MRRLLVLVVMAGATAFSASPANACLCGRQPARAEALRDAELVFVGEVEKALPGYHWQVRVHAVAKGQLPERVAVNDHYAATSCGSAIEGRWDRQAGGGRFVYAGTADLDASTCGRHVWGPAAEVVTQLGLETYPPIPSPPDRSRAVLLAIVSAAGVLLGIRWVTSRRIAAASASDTTSAG